MTSNDNVQASATGCLSRVFTAIGLFWAGAVALGVIRNLNSGFDTDLTGAIFPALAFLFAGNLMRKRAQEARARDTFSAPTTPTGTHRATTKPATTVESTPDPIPILGESREQIKKKPERPVPELPPLEPAPDPGKLPAIDKLEMSDFEPGKALSSEERIRLAREKYSKKKPHIDPKYTRRKGSSGPR